MIEKTNQQRRRVVLGGLASVPLLAAHGLAEAQKSNGKASPAFNIPAKPEPISLRAATSAVIVVDMQNDFGSKGGMFDRAGVDIAGIQKVVAPTARVLAASRAAGIKVIYLKMAFRPDLSDMGAADSVNRVRHLKMNVGKTVRAPDGRESRILIRDTWNTDIVAELKPEASDITVYKHRFSGFYETELHATLKRLGIRHLIFTGCTTSICVESTVRDAMFRDYLPVLLADCMNEPIAQSNHEASLLSTEVSLGWISSSEEFMTALSRSRSASQA